MTARATPGTNVVTTKPLRLVGSPDLVRLRALPAHPVHTSALKALHQQQQRRTSDDDRIMMLYARDVGRLDLRAYVMYQQVHDHLVLIDGMYSPFAGQGHGSELLQALEGRVASGSTVALVSSPDATRFFEARGYQVPVPFRRRLAGLGHLVLAKYVT